MVGDIALYSMASVFGRKVLACILQTTASVIDMGRVCILLRLRRRLKSKPLPRNWLFPTFTLAHILDRNKHSFIPPNPH